MRGILWPLLGALLIPAVGVSILAVNDPAALRSADPTVWLGLAGLGALAGMAFFLQARITGDGDHPLSRSDPRVEAAYRSGDDRAGDQLVADEGQHATMLRIRATKSRLAARRYRIYLETGIKAIDELLASREATPLDREAIRRDRSRLTQDLAWAREREGTLGRWLA